MIPVVHCLICGTYRLAFAPAKVSPFIIERCCLESPLPEVRSAYCPSCDFVFFDHRYGEEETRRLYEGYRDEAYTERRLFHEPYYHVMMEPFEEGREASRADRILNLRRLFGGITRTFPDVLDYGGEADAWLARGAFPDAAVTTYDLSFEARLPEPRSQDLVICSNVLEHASFPLELLTGLRRYLKPGGLICLEMPLEHFGDLRQFHARGEGVVHEHVSFYSPKSVFRLLHRAGLRPLDSGRLYGGLHGVVARPSRLGAWPRVLDLLAPAVPPDPAPSPGKDPLLPSRVIEGVDALVDQWKAEGTRVVLAPAGNYSRGLLEHTRLKEVALVGVCDRNPAAEDLLGIPIHPYGDLGSLRPDLILVASPEHERSICESLAGQGRQALALSKLIWP